MGYLVNTTARRRQYPAHLKIKTLSWILVSSVYCCHAWGQSPYLTLHLKAQPLHQAVDQLAQQGNIQILYASALLGDRTAVALSGQYSVEQALQHLLSGSNLEIKKQGKVYLIVEKPSPSPKPRASRISRDSPQHQSENFLYQMPAIEVEAQDDQTKFGQSVINQAMVERYQANNIAQLLDNMPSVSSAGSPRPGGQTLNILGMGAVEDVPISVDDAVKTFDKYRQGSVFIEPEVIKSITVNKGPHDVEVGNGGFGGNVVVETRDAVDFLKNGKKLGGMLKYSRYSNNDQDTYSGLVYGQSRHNMVDALVYFTKRDSGNVQRPDGTDFLYSAQTQDTYLAKLNLKLADAHKVSLKAMHSSHQGWEPFAAKRDQDAVPTAADIARYGYDEAWKRRLVYRDQSDESYSIAYEYQPQSRPWINLKAVLSHSKTDQHDTRLPSVTGSSSTLGNESWVTYTNTDFKLTNVSDFHSAYGDHQLKIGFEYLKMKQQSLIFDRPNSSKADYNYGYYQPNYMPAGDQQTYSVFIQDRYQLGPITLTPSLRYDHVRNQGYGNYASRFNSSDPAVGHDYSAKSYAGWSPRLALAWQQNQNLSWFANISQTWRAPRVDEQYYVQSAATTQSATSRYLDPETMLALRVGNEIQFKDLFDQQDQFKVRLTFHRNRGKDEIFRSRSVFCQAQAESIAQGGSSSSSLCNGNYQIGFYRNITGYTILAYEAEIFYEQPSFFAGLTYAYIRGQRDNSPVNPWFAEKTWIEEIPPRKATATLGVKVPEHRLILGWRGSFVDRQDRSIVNTDNSTGAQAFSLPRTSGYALHHIFVEWLPLPDESVKVNFGIDNLLNKDYKMYLGEYMTGTGRDYKLSVSYQF
jgi:hemoglobin/transferrin/lactoferrin receptor protein